MFSIRLGLPEMEECWTDLSAKASTKSLSKDEEKLYKKGQGHGAPRQ